MNSHDLWEIPLNLSDSTLMGSSDSLFKMREVMSRLHVKTDDALIKADGYIECLESQDCGASIFPSESEIFQGVTYLKYVNISYLSESEV